MTTAFEHLGFTADSLETFSGLYRKDGRQGRYVFSCTHLQGYSFTGNEMLYYDGTRIVPASFYWAARPDGDCMVARVYLFASAVDAMALHQVKGRAYFSNSVMVALGRNPSFRLLELLRSRFAAARFSLCFANNYLGKVCDIKVACLLQGIAVSVQSTGLYSIAAFSDRSVRMRSGDISLSRFERAAGINLSARTIKPRGYVSFLDVVRAGAMGNPDLR